MYNMNSQHDLPSLTISGEPPMQYARLYTDLTGETHFGTLTADFTLADYAPPAPPLYTAEFNPAAAYGMLRLPAGWYGDWHPVPSRQLQIFLSGTLEAQASDGSTWRASPGALILVEDTSGKGHKSWVVGEEEVVIFVVRLA
jgi:hypothetical protein